MDIKQFFRRGPALGSDPLEGLPAREFVIADTRSEAIDSTAATLTGMSSMALKRVGVVMRGPEQAAENLRPAPGRPRTPESRPPVEDLTRRILNDLGNRRVREIMSRRVRGPSPRQAI